MSIEYAYDRNGNLIRDDNKCMTFTYDLLGHPLTIAGSDNQTDYVYSADGRKLRATHTQCTFKNGALAVCHYFIQDYQGNNRVLIGTNGKLDQLSHYYPYGSLMGDLGTKDPHSYKYGGKELDRDFGIDLFDFEARQYDAKVPGFTSIDPLAEKYYGISPYAYCAGDPVNLVDPTGLAPSDTTGLKIAGHIYDGNVGDVIDGYKCLKIVPFKEGSIRMGLYGKEKEDGTMDYVIANAGTDDIVDAIEDVKQHFSETDGMEKSVEQAKKWNNQVDAAAGDEMTNVGHSKGGLEATANALATNTNAMVYDPAPISRRVARRMGKGYEGQIISFKVKGTFIRWIDPHRNAPIGQTIRLNPTFRGFHPFKNHHWWNINPQNIRR